MSAPRLMLPISIPGTSLKKTLKLKSHVGNLDNLSQLAEELSLINWEKIFENVDYEKHKNEWIENYERLVMSLQ